MKLDQIRNLGFEAIELKKYRKQIDNVCDIIVLLEAQQYIYLERSSQKLYLEKQPQNEDQLKGLIEKLYSPYIASKASNTENIDNFIELLKTGYVVCSKTGPIDESSEDAIVNLLIGPNNKH